ncbi:hypothetical protein [Aeromonas sobria]|uniref:hypothetical protein n=1 Tax=Aeromonas sobria TaxID=646 RepID=UPI0012FF244F|nr:hypothetical protein [Aeromonas sobria]
MRNKRISKKIEERETTLSSMRRDQNLSGERGTEIQRLQEAMDRAKESSIYLVIRHKRILKKPYKRLN